MISLSRLNRILNLDILNARVTVEPGVINAAVSQRVAPYGYFYAPDPSSQSVCSIGGNVAENSGGAHCLKYGFTTTHVLGLEVVLPDGSLVQLGGNTLDTPGYDLPGVFVGSEGTLGVTTKVMLRIVKRPEVIQTLLAAFDSTNAAGAAVSDIIASGILPAAIEMMDNLAIQAAEAAVHAGYPNCGGLLLVDGWSRRRGGGANRWVKEKCLHNRAWEIRVAQSEAERIVIWKGRKERSQPWGESLRTTSCSRSHSADRAASGDGRDSASEHRGRIARSERLPRGRWQSAPTRSV